MRWSRGFGGPRSPLNPLSMMAVGVIALAMARDGFFCVLILTHFPAKKALLMGIAGSIG